MSQKKIVMWTTVCHYHTHPQGMGGSVQPLKYFPTRRGTEPSDERMGIFPLIHTRTHSHLPLHRPCQARYWGYYHTHTRYLCPQFNLFPVIMDGLFTSFRWQEKTPPMMSADKPHSGLLGQYGATQHQRILLLQFTTSMSGSCKGRRQHHNFSSVLFSLSRSLLHTLLWCLFVAWPCGVRARLEWAEWMATGIASHSIVGGRGKKSPVAMLAYPALKMNCSQWAHGLWSAADDMLDSIHRAWQPRPRCCTERYRLFIQSY